MQILNSVALNSKKQMAIRMTPPKSERHKYGTASSSKIIQELLPTNDPPPPSPPSSPTQTCAGFLPDFNFCREEDLRGSRDYDVSSTPPSSPLATLESLAVAKPVLAPLPPLPPLVLPPLPLIPAAVHLPPPSLTVAMVSDPAADVERDDDAVSLVSSTDEKELKATIKKNRKKAKQWVAYFLLPCSVIVLLKRAMDAMLA